MVDVVAKILDEPGFWVVGCNNGAASEDSAGKAWESGTSAKFEHVLSLDKVLSVIFEIHSDNSSSIPEEVTLCRLASRRVPVIEQLSTPRGDYVLAGGEKGGDQP